jgi:hypothetical protein
MSDTVKYCFWDKHPFAVNVNKEVKCPIAYKPAQIVHKKREYYINQNVSACDTKVGEGVKVIQESITYTDTFCSERCLLAWINENACNPLYKNSKYIFYKEYYKKNGYGKVYPANHWRTLNAFGGFMTIEQFRSCNKNYEESNVYIDESGERIIEYEEVVKIS